MSPRRTSRAPAERSRLKNVALFAEADDASVANTLTLERITLQKTQPRRYFDPQAMQSLVESIKQDGILQPLLVRPVGEKYEVVAGERRYRAAQSAGLTEVPVIIRPMSDLEAVQYALVENLQREDLNPVEETSGILQLLALNLKCPAADVPSLLYRMQKEAKGKTVAHNVMGLPEAETVQAVFGSLGRMSWDSFASNRLPLLNLPDNILSALREGRIEYTKAKEIAKIESESEREKLLEEAIAQNLTLSQIRSQLKAFKPPTEHGELQSRMSATYKLAKKSKVWEHPKKREQLESLLAELEALIAEPD